MKKTAVVLFSLLVGVVCAEERDPFAEPFGKKAAELKQCAKGHKTLKNIPVVYGHVGALVSSPEVRAKAERGEILFGGCVAGGREHRVACETCGFLYDDEHDAWLESHPPRPMSPEGRNNPPCTLDTFQSSLSNEIQGVALKMAGVMSSRLSCSRCYDASGVVGEEAVVVSKINESEAVRQLLAWIKEKGGPEQPSAEHSGADGKMWRWNTKDRLFVVTLRPAGSDEFHISIDWHRKKAVQPRK